MKAKDIKLLQSFDNDLVLQLTLSRNNETIQKVSKLKEITEKGKLLDVVIKQHKQIAKE